MMIAKVAMTVIMTISMKNIPDDDGTQNRSALDPYDILYVLEILLSFHAWYKCGGPYNCGNSVEQHKIHKAISEMLETVKESS